MSPKEQNPDALPPRWPDRVVEYFCAPHLREEVIGDLHERYYLRVRKVGEAKANRQYWREVLAYLRPSIFKRKTKTNNSILPTDMLQHYLLTTIRQLSRRIGISLIYLVGLTLGIASSLLIFLVVDHEYSFDQYHTKGDRIYRIETTKVEQGGTYSGTPTGVPAALRNDFQAIEKVGAVLRRHGSIVPIEQGKEVDEYKESVAFVENEIFQMLVLGSNRGQLIHQFLSEAGFITLLALILSLGVAYLSLPYISQLLGITIAPDLIWSLHSIVFLLSVFVFTSLLAGFYPALVLSSLSPVGAMKKALKGRLTSGLSLRNGLVVFQFSISLVLIIGTLIIGQQLQSFKNANLGFDHTSVITVEVPVRDHSRLEGMRQELLAFPSIQNVSFSNNSPSSESNWMGIVTYKQEGEAVEIGYQQKMVDTYFLDTYDIPLVAGEKFRQGDTLSKAIINEVMVNRMGLSNPQDAIGRTLHLDQKGLTIIGVVKNFHVNSLHQKIDPTLLLIDPRYYQASIKLHQASLTAENMEETLTHLQQVWTSTFPEHIFSYQFLDQTLEEAYLKEIQTAQLVNTATGIAIFISCLGLLGLVIFTAEQRVKEIGIRKVLGASAGNIFGLFSKDYLKLILIANAFAWPIAWWGMRKWLENFEYRIEISWWMFAVAALAGIVIAGLTISFQSIKAALANPVDSLRNE